jgi:hypothetical protein
MPCDPLKFSDPETYEACVDTARQDRWIELEKIIATGDVEGLAEHLRDAERAHEGLGTDWPRFYAQYLLGVI